MELETPVKTLDELKRILDPKPLRLEELEDLFVETNAARDAEVSRRVEIAEILAEGVNTKVLLAGHGGTGKSTELVKFRSEHQDSFAFVQLSIIVDGDPAKVNIEGLLVLIAETVLRQMRDQGIALNEDSLKKIHAWFQETFKVRESSRSYDGEVGGGIAAQESYLAKLVGLTADLKGSIKTGSDVVWKTIQKNESRLPDLAAHCGELLKEAELAVQRTGQRLLLVVEDLDKIPVGAADRLFIENPAPLAGLPVQSVFTAPIFILCNPRAAVLDSHFEIVTMPMIKVEDQEGRRYEPGWEAIRKILAHRIDLAACIDEDAIDLAIDKTAGVLRHLFQTLRHAARAAGQDFQRGHRAEERIILSDVRYGLDRVKSDVILRRIGVMGLPEEFSKIETEHLYQRLKDFKSPQRVKSDRINLLLMQAHAILEYNGKQWHRVHPLVAEYLDELRQP
jgi:Cdc6-like AAA superfamily ATPase